MGMETWARRAFTTIGPTVMLGTKWPSMTSTCSQSAPAAWIASASSPRRAKSADNMEGAIRGWGVLIGSRPSTSHAADEEPVETAGGVVWQDAQPAFGHEARRRRTAL